MEFPFDKNNDTIIAIGSSAGGFEAIKTLLNGLAANLNRSAIIIAQHLSPHHESQMAQLLAGHTQAAVKRVESNMKLEVNGIYITPENQDVVISKGELVLKKPTNPLKPKPSIDRLFKSLAQEEGVNKVGIILSGTGFDGSNGIQDLKKKGALILVQDAQSAKYDGMPRAAISTGFPDMVLDLEQMSHILNDLIKSNHFSKLEEEPSILEESDVFQKIFRTLSEESQIQFQNYKKPMLQRRLQLRMEQLKISNSSSYYDYLRSNPLELKILLDTLLIGVTAFFRDPKAFENLQNYLLKHLESLGSDEVFRVWISACASGEEAYIIAILIVEALEKLDHKPAVKIFASDVDLAAISKARRGIYSKEQLKEVSKHRLDTHFQTVKEGYKVKKSIRNMVLFSHHDLTSHPPFLKLDLITCRNLLIYFNTKLQGLLLNEFCYALKDNGLLFLGASDSLNQTGDYFKGLDAKAHVYAKKNPPDIGTLSFPLALRMARIKPAGQESGKLSTEAVMDKAILKNIERTFILINSKQEVVEIRGDTDAIFSLKDGKLSTQFLRLLKEELQLDGRTLLNKVTKGNTLVKGRPKLFLAGKKRCLLQMLAYPVDEESWDDQHYMIAIDLIEIPSATKIAIGESRKQGEDRVQELAHELAITKEQLQNLVEELETSNEELQSMNEEMQTTNEELQSTNEELATSNEELQSTNEEMQIAYTELREVNTKLAKKEASLNQTKANFLALLNSSMHASLLLDHQQTILAFNQLAEIEFSSLFGSELRLGDPIQDHLGKDFQAVFNENYELALKGNRVSGEMSILHKIKGKSWYRFSHSPVQMGENKAMGVAFSMMDINSEKSLGYAYLETESILNSVFQSADVGIAMADRSGKFIKVNQRLTKIFNYTSEQLLGREIDGLVPHEDRKTFNKDLDKAFENNDPLGERSMLAKNGEIVDVFIHNSPIKRENNNDSQLLLIIRDISEFERNRNLLEGAQKAGKIGGWEYDPVNDQLTWTDEVYRIVGIKHRDEVDLQWAVERYTPASKEKINNALNDCIQFGTPFDLDLEYYTLKQEKIWVKATGRAIRLYNKTVKVYGTFQDITDQRLAQMEIDKLSLVASKTNNAVIITDAEGYTEWVNEGFEKISDYTLAEIKGKKPGQLLQGEKTDPESVKRIRKGLAKGESFTEEILNYSKKGKAYWLNLSISPVKDAEGVISNFIAIQTDITDNKKSEQELKKSETTLRSVVENNAEAIFLVNDRFEIELFNQKALEVFNRFYKVKLKKGLQLIEALEKGVSDPADYLVEALGKAMHGEEFVEVMHYIKDLKVHYYEKSFFPIKKEEKVAGISVFIKDISERVNYEKQLRYRVQFQNLFSRISSSFVNVQRQKEFQAALHTGLANIGSFTDSERAFVYLRQSEASEFELVQHWTKNGLAEHPLPKPKFDFKTFPFSYHKLEKKELLILRKLEDLPKKALQERKAFKALGTKASILMPVVIENKLGGVLIFDRISSEKKWDESEVMLMKITSEVISNAMERKLAYDQIRNSEQLYKSLAENLPNGTISILNDELEVEFMEGKGLNKKNHWQGKKIWELYGEDNKAFLKDHLKSVIFSGKTDDFELAYGDRFYRLNALPLKNIDRKVDRIMMLMQDITKQKTTEIQLTESLKDKEILLKEVHHRVKNNMQVISGLIKLQSSTIEDQKVKHLFEEATTRIKSMAIIHEKLYQSSSLSKIEFRSYLKDLINNIKQTYGNQRAQVRVSLHVDDIHLEIAQAVPCGLLINELLSNAYKHAFVGRDNGKIIIEMNVQEGEKVKLIVKDDGVGYSPEKVSKTNNSLGLTLIDALSRQLSAEMDFDGSHGAQYQMIFQIK